MKSRMAWMVLMAAAGVFAQGPNLVKNGGFEELDGDGYPKGWSVKKDVWSSSTENKYEGERSFLHDNRTPGNYKFVTQRVPVEIGKSYEFSIAVKVVVSPEATNKNIRPNLFLEYYNDDKYVGGMYSPTQVPLNTDWVKLVGKATIPESAKQVSVGFRATPDGVAGVKMWFDNCDVHEITMPPLTGILTTDCYRDQAAGGDVTVLCGRGTGKSALVGVDMSKVELAVKDASGKIVFTKMPEQVMKDRMVYRFSADALAAGKYMLSCTVSADGKTFKAEHAFTKLDKAPEYKCYVDKHHRMILDGKPFFPLGMYFSNLDKAQMAPFIDSKFNCVMPYNSPRTSAEMLDFAQEHGIKVFYSIKDNVSAHGDAEATLAKQKQGLAWLEAFKNHPAIAAWYINDELKEQFVGDAIQYRQACEELDPSRPTWSVLCIPDEFHAFTTSSDIHGCDPYPIPGGTPDRAYSWTKRISDSVMGSKMIIQVPQAFCWGRYWVRYGYAMKTCAECRRPTYEEIDAMSWMCIAGGANGLIYYSYFDLLLRDKPIGELPAIPFDEHFGDCKKVAERIMRHEKVLLSADEPAKFDVADNGGTTVFRAYGLDGDTWILAVNTSEKASSTFTLKTASVMKLVGTTLSTPEVKMAGNNITGTLRPLESVFLQLR